MWLKQKVAQALMCLKLSNLKQLRPPAYGGLLDIWAIERAVASNGSLSNSEFAKLHFSSATNRVEVVRGPPKNCWTLRKFPKLSLFVNSKV